MNLKKEQLLELFNSSLDNAYSLFEAANETAKHLKIKKFPSLGLAELALEELGKSYSCLAMYSKAGITKDWSLFWKEWRNHDLKAHRAFFYEFFCMTRVEIDFNGKELKFPTLRQDFSKEKEAAFYVDIDKGNGKIHKPAIEISDNECLRRIVSLMGLFSAAFYIRDWLKENKSEDFRNAISDYAYRTITTEMYQQDAIGILLSMKNKNEDYCRGVDKIIELFANS